MVETESSMSEASRFLLAVVGGLLFSLACLTAALGPANAGCTCSAAIVSFDRPALL